MGVTDPTAAPRRVRPKRRRVKCEACGWHGDRAVGDVAPCRRLRFGGQPCGGHVVDGPGVRGPGRTGRTIAVRLPAEAFDLLDRAPHGAALEAARLLLAALNIRA